MAKGIIVLDEVPEKCNKCRFWFAKATVPVEYICMGLQIEITENELTKEKPDWCPIKEIPVRLEELKYSHSMGDYQRKGFSRGWNACLDEIEGSAEK